MLQSLERLEQSLYTEMLIWNRSERPGVSYGPADRLGLEEGLQRPAVILGLKQVLKAGRYIRPGTGSRGRPLYQAWNRFQRPAVILVLEQILEAGRYLGLQQVLEAGSYTRPGTGSRDRSSGQAWNSWPLGYAWNRFQRPVFRLGLEQLAVRLCLEQVLEGDEV